MIWYLVIAIFIIFIYQYLNDSDMHEGFVSGTETLSKRYDGIYPLDHPKYTTPQQKDFQVVLSEHSALDSNLQTRRKDIMTQHCQVGSHCFDTREWHSLNYRHKSSPDIINTKIGYQAIASPNVVYLGDDTNLVKPKNAVTHEMRADLFDNIVLPDLFFKRKVISQR